MAEVPYAFDDEKDRPIEKEIESRTIIASKREKERLIGFEYSTAKVSYIFTLRMLVQQTQCLASL